MSLNARARSGTLPATLGLMAVLAVVPLLPIDDRMLSALTFALISGIALVGLDIFSGYSGQPSFGNFGFVAVGAYTSAMLTTNAGWPVLATLPASIAACIVASLVLGLPMMKLPELGGALMTYFFAFVAFVLINGQALEAWTMGPNGIPVTPLEMGGFEFYGGRPLYYLSWAMLLIAAVIACRYADSRAGRALRVIKRGEVLAASMGISVSSAKLSAFVFSAATAGLAGWVFAQALGYLSPESFMGIESVNLVAMAVVGGLGSICGPIIGALFFGVASELSREFNASRDMLFAVMLLVSLVFLPGGLYSLLDHVAAFVPSFGRRRAADATGSMDSTPGVAPAAASAPARQGDAATKPLLSVEGVSVSFGGVVALDSVNLQVNPGEIYAIMGPNGAGKTTLLNCISGIQPFSGDVRLDGRSLGGMKPAEVRRAGISRTFQHPSLVGDLTVEENVATGAYALAPTFPYRDVLPLPDTIARDRQARQQATHALDMVRFPVERRGVLTGDLTLAEQKVVDIARSISGSSRLLLLDEPTAGLAEDDIGRIVDVLLRVNKETGLTILVIAHHIGFLRSVAEQATVLDFGKELAQGPIDEVTQSEDVIKVFLG